MTLEIKSTKRDAPIRLLVYADGGVGKTSLGASAPNPIFIASESGLSNIDAKAITPENWGEALKAVDIVAGLDFKTVVVDSLDWLEPMCWAHVCKESGKKDIETFGYGKGYVVALDQWRVFIHRLASLHAKGMHVVLIAHAISKTFQNPDGDDFNKWQIKLHDKAAGLFKEWVDIVGFAQKEFSTVEQENKRSKALSTGRRVLRTDGGVSFDAKTRYAMPKSILLDWASLETAVRNGSISAADRLKQEIHARLAELGDKEVEAKVHGFLESAGWGMSSLVEAKDRLDVTISERRKAS